MKIDEQIKALMRRKAEIELFTKLADNLEAELDSKDPEYMTLEKEHPGLLKSFVDKVGAFCLQHVEALNEIETTKVDRRPKVETVQVPYIVPETEVEQTPPPPPPPVEDEPLDPIKFLLKHRNLDSKRVEFTTKDGVVQGTVRGLVTPNVLVDTDTGHTVKVPPKELRVL